MEKKSSSSDDEANRDTSFGGSERNAPGGADKKKKSPTKRSIKLLRLPTAASLRDWKVHLRKAVMNASGLGLVTLGWLLETEMRGVTFDMLAVTDNEYFDVEMLLSEPPLFPMYQSQENRCFGKVCRNSWCTGNAQCKLR